MRWRLKAKGYDKPIDVELIKISEGSYTFQINGKTVLLTNPKRFPFSLSTNEVSMTLESWTAQRWRAVVEANTYQVEPLSWEGTRINTQNKIRTQMPGRVLKVLVQAGSPIKVGQTLLIMEAMKMENEIRAESDAIVDRVAVEANQSVESGALLLELKNPE